MIGGQCRTLTSSDFKALAVVANLLLQKFTSKTLRYGNRSIDLKGAKLQSPSIRTHHTPPQLQRLHDPRLPDSLLAHTERRSTLRPIRLICLPPIGAQPDAEAVARRDLFSVHVQPSSPLRSLLPLVPVLEPQHPLNVKLVFTCATIFHDLVD